MKCKYCGEEFDNKGKLMNHYKVCPEKDKPTGCCKSLTQSPQTCEVAGEAFVLVPVEDYIPYECINAEIVEREQRIRVLEQELAKQKEVDAEIDGKIYWPLSKLPKEISLLADGMFVAMQVSGRIKQGRVHIEDVKL